MSNESPFNPTQENPSPIKGEALREPRVRRDVKADVAEFLARKKSEAERAKLLHDAKVSRASRGG
jgi:hypothetical protein